MRNEILERCPEEFRDELKQFIDDIETLVSDIQYAIEIDNVNEIGSIANAATLVRDLMNKLY